MTNIVQANTYSTSMIEAGTAWPARRTLPDIPSEPSQDEPKVYENLDPRTEQMIELLLKEEFTSPRALHRVRTKLVFWVIRNQMLSWLKRAFDVAFALAALIVFSPVIMLTAVAIKLDSPGPVFFKQVRVGKRGKEFNCYKFRSMVVNANSLKKDLMDKNEADGVVFKIRKDPRITRVGSIIRKLSIDEIPAVFERGARQHEHRRAAAAGAD